MGFKLKAIIASITITFSGLPSHAESIIDKHNWPFAMDAFNSVTLKEDTTANTQAIEDIRTSFTEVLDIGLKEHGGCSIDQRGEYLDDKDKHPDHRGKAIYRILDKCEPQKNHDAFRLLNKKAGQCEHVLQHTSARCTVLYVNQEDLGRPKNLLPASANGKIYYNPIQNVDVKCFPYATGNNLTDVTDYQSFHCCAQNEFIKAPSKESRDLQDSPLAGNEEAIANCDSATRDQIDTSRQVDIYNPNKPDQPIHIDWPAAAPGVDR